MAKYSAGIDPHGAGLRIRLFKSGKCVYQETIKCDPESQAGITAATQRRKWLKARLDLGLPLFEGERNSTLFEDVAQGYLNTLDAKHSTHIGYENILNHYWMPVFAGWPVTDIRARDIKDHLATLSISKKTKKNILGPLRGLLGYGEVNPNPCAGITFRRRDQDSGSPDSYTLDQRDDLIAAISRLPVPDWFTGQPVAYFALLFGCGLRPCGEPLALQWSDYDGTWLDVSKQITKRRLQLYTKTDVRRRVFVPSWVRPHLNALPTRFEGGYLFQNSQGNPHLDTDHFNPLWKAAHRKARIPEQVPYACRHTRASELLSTGIHPGDAAKQLGHSIEMFIRTYAEWVEQFAGALEDSRFEGVTVKNGRIGQSGKKERE